MQFTLASIALCASGALALTIPPPDSGSVAVGQPVTIKVIRTADETGEVTLILRKQGSNPNNLDTVQTIGTTSGDSFTWTPSASLPDLGAVYAYEGTLGSTDAYSSVFAITGGSAAYSSASSSSSTSTSSSSISSTPSGYMSTSSASSSSMSSSSSSTTSAAVPVTTVSTNGTTVVAPVTTNSAGMTIPVISSNGTLSNTLTSRTTTMTVGAGAGASETTDAGYQTSTGTPAQQTGDSGAIANYASPLALVIAGIAALF